MKLQGFNLPVQIVDWMKVSLKSVLSNLQLEQVRQNPCNFIFVTDLILCQNRDDIVASICLSPLLKNLSRLLP